MEEFPLLLINFKKIPAEIIFLEIPFITIKTNSRYKMRLIVLAYLVNTNKSNRQVESMLLLSLLYETF